MATGLLYSSVTPLPTHFKGYPDGMTTVQAVSPLITNSQVQIDNKLTYHKLLITLLVNAGSGSTVVVQTMDGDSSNVVDLIGGTETIISGTLSASTTIRVGSSDVTVTLTTDGTDSSLSVTAGEIQSSSIIKVPGVNGTLAVTASGMVYRRQSGTDYTTSFNVQVNGNSEVPLASTDRQFILKGTKTSSQTVNVPQPTVPPETIVVSGVYAECIDANQTNVSEV